MAVTVLYWLTLAIVLAVVLALAGYLVAIAWMLIGAMRHVARLADGLEAVAGVTAPLPEHLGAVAEAVPRIADAFEGVDDALARCGRAFGRT